MARILYRSKAPVRVVAGDCTYYVYFEDEIERCKAWELDRNNDTDMSVNRKTGNIRVRFCPVLNTMVFPEDSERKLHYIMSVEHADDMRKTIADKVNFWYALDIAANICQ